MYHTLFTHPLKNTPKDYSFLQADKGEIGSDYWGLICVNIPSKKMRLPRAFKTLIQVIKSLQCNKSLIIFLVMTHPYFY